MEFSLITMAATGSTNYEQMANALKITSIVLFVLAAVSLAFAIFAFVFFKIPNVIGDLTGRNARKSIEQMRQENEKGGKKTHRPHPVAVDRGTLTEPIKENKKANKKQSKVTKKPDTVSQPTNEGSGATDVLEDPNATERLDYDPNGTEILNSGTEVLSNETIQAALNEKTVDIKMIQDIVFVHTEEVI